MKRINETAHTPGPWEVGSGDNYYISSESYPAAFPHRFKGDDTGDHLAYVGNRTSDFGEANARLIAAAPELLAALVEADGCFEAALCEGWIEALESGNIETIRDLWHRRLSYARSLFPAALAAARDEEGIKS